MCEKPRRLTFYAKLNILKEVNKKSMSRFKINVCALNSMPNMKTNPRDPYNRKINRKFLVINFVIALLSQS